MWMPIVVPVETGTHPPRPPPPWIPAFAGMTIWVPTVVPVETGTHPRPPPAVAGMTMWVPIVVPVETGTHPPGRLPGWIPAHPSPRE